MNVHKVQNRPRNLFYISDTRWLKALANLKMSSHTLEIERGRHVKPQTIPLEQPTCQRFTPESDDEVHFLISCSYSLTSLLAESKLHNTEFEALKRRTIHLHYVIYTSTVINMLSKIHLYLFINLMHAMYPLLINGCFRGGGF